MAQSEKQPLKLGQQPPVPASPRGSVGLHLDFGTVYNGAPNGIPYVTYSDESDPGPYAIPSDAPIERGADSTGDRHVIVVERDQCVLYEMWNGYPQSDGTWTPVRAQSSLDVGRAAPGGLDFRRCRWTTPAGAGAI